MLIGAIVAAVIAIAMSIYSYVQMRKMQKKNRPKPNQIDGTIADEGVSFCDIAGSPHIHPNITDLWNKKSDAIKQKSGGFLGIGKSSQVTGYRYYTSFSAFIGNRIEKFIAINFDNRGWIVHDPTKHPVNMLPVNNPSLFGQDAGGVVGNIDIEFGYPQPQQNLAYKQHFDLVSAYPYQSYLVFRGNTIDQPFYFGNSNYMKEMSLWVKRTRVKNDGDGQWYEVRGDGAVVCEIGSYININYPGSVSKSGQGTYRGLTKNKQEIANESAFNWRFDEISDPENLFLTGVAPNTFVSQIESATQYLPSTCLIVINIESGALGLMPFKLTFTSYNESISIEYIGNAKISSFKSRKTSENSLSTLYEIEGVFVVERPGEIGAIAEGLGYNLGPSGEAIFGVGGTISLYKPTSHYATVDMESPDINPIHKIREILTDDTAMGKPESDVNDANFIKAADRIWDEGLGVSWAIDEKACIDAVEELCYHIEAGIRVNRQTGLYEMVLFRDDWFAENEIHSIVENKIKDLSLEVMNSDDIVNQLNVTYYDRERIKNSTFSIYENGSILTMGKANAESIEFPYFMNMRNAEIVANWKLKQYSTPAWKGTFTTGWREARKWNRYDLVKINWSKKWQGTILARIMKIDLGNGLNNEVMIDFEEVVPYSGEMNTSIVVDDSTEEKAEPAKPAIGETFEAPYYIAVQNIGQRKVDEELAYNQDVGFTFSTYRRPQWNALYTEITSINADNPENGWVVDGNAEFVTGGQFDQVVSRTATQIVVKNINIEGLFGSGDLIVAGSGLVNIVGLYEFMIVESFDSETNILTVKRGALDTIPTQWDVNGWFFVSNADDGLFSLTEYSAGDNVRASSLTVTPSSKLAQVGSSFVSMRSRLFRPYPPANVKFNGVYYPETIITTNDIVLTWLGRNRLASQVVDFYNALDDAELNTTYSYELISENVVLDSGSAITGNTATILSSVLIPNKPHTLKLWSVRDGYDSYQSFEHSFFAESVSLVLTAATDGSSVTGNTVPVANISVNVDESLSANMKFDGSAISGKAEAGATITIEIQE
ncbi:MULTISPECIES: phage tail protein [unclassified Acinetobacter]|uniref:phage tail protein n=1 Tax=unclassified Acinetobacter TaxID=196816 RepID=UPI0015D2B53F|nr:MULTISPECIES: phage tail protein [unclassified Acinetobacter]